MCCWQGFLFYSFVNIFQFSYIEKLQYISTGEHVASSYMGPSVLRPGAVWKHLSTALDLARLQNSADIHNLKCVQKTSAFKPIKLVALWRKLYFQVNILFLM